MERCKVALVQMDSQADRERNMRDVEAAVAEAASCGAGFVMFPETVEYIGEDFMGNASEIPGPLSGRFGRLAREYGIWLHAGSVTERRGEKPCNLTMVFAPDGRLAAGYRKVHLFDVEVEDGPSYRESDEIAPGNRLVLADTGMGRMGLSICYDLRFPQMYRLYADRGAEILAVAANFTDATGAAHWEPLLRARAIENTCYVLACGQCGVKPAFRAHGHSMIVDPWGRILAEAGEEPEILYAELEPEALENARRQVPCLRNQRGDLYALEAKAERIFGNSPVPMSLR